MTDRNLSRTVIAVAIAIAIAGCGRNDPDKFIASAETYLAKSNYPAAIIELKNALSKAPDNARARFLLGKASLDGGDPVGAATELRKALTLNYAADDVYPLLAQALAQQGAPKNEILALANAPVQSAHAKAELAATIGSTYLSLGQTKDARAQIESALALEPANLNARFAQARLMAVENDLAGALQRVGEVLATAPDTLDALMLKSELEIALGRRGDAILTLERVLVRYPEMLPARYVLASTYVQAKDIDKAAVQVDELKKRAPADARTLHAMGFVAFARGDMPTARDAVQKALEAAPEYLPALFLSGLVDLKRGAFVAAEQSLRTVVAKAPNDDAARVALAQAQLQLNQADKAQETLDATLRRAPNDTAALRLAAEIQLALKRPDKAAEYLERVNARDKNYVGGRVRLAEVRLAKGETGQGVRDLEALVASEPDKTEPDVALIAAHLRARNYDQALAAADALIKKRPQDPASQNTKGVVQIAKGDLKGARQSFDKALALDAGFVSASYNLARLDTSERNFAGAKERYERIIAKDPKAERALLGLAELLVATNAPSADVAAALRRAVEAKPESVPARLALISFYARQKDWRAALTAAQAAQAAIPDNPPLLEALAAVQQAAGEQNQAIESYTRLAKYQPDNPLPLMRVAGIQASLKNYDAAIASLKSALALAPDNLGIGVLLAGAYMDASKPDVGFAEAHRLQKAQPTRAAGFGLEAELLAAQKKLPEAVAAYRMALARQPLASAVIRLDTLLFAMGRPDEAASVTQKWVKDHPKDVPVRYHLAQRSLVQGDFKTAAVLYRAAIENDPANAAMLNNLAWSLSQLNDAKAVEYAERAFRIAPNDAAVANTYGWILVQRGETAQGVQLLRRAVEIDPADAPRRLYLAKALIKSGDKAGARKELEIVAKADSKTARTEAEQLLKDL